MTSKITMNYDFGLAWTEIPFDKWNFVKSIAFITWIIGTGIFVWQSCIRCEICWWPFLKIRFEWTVFMIHIVWNDSETLFRKRVKTQGLGNLTLNSIVLEYMCKCLFFQNHFRSFWWDNFRKKRQIWKLFKYWQSLCPRETPH